MSRRRERREGLESRAALYDTTKGRELIRACWRMAPPESEWDDPPEWQDERRKAWLDYWKDGGEAPRWGEWRPA